MTLVVVLVLLAVMIVVLRLLGAWMLRINEVIDELKEIKKEFRKGQHKF